MSSAWSTFLMVMESTDPNRFVSRARSTDRIWFKIAAEVWLKPVLPDGITTSRGWGGSPNCELMAATIVIGLYWFETSFCMTSAGRVFFIVAPPRRIESDEVDLATPGVCHAIFVL